MSTFTMCCLCLCALAAGSIPMSAQDVVSYAFTAEITSLRGEHTDLGQDIEIGDELILEIQTGSNASEFYRDDVMTDFDLYQSPAVQFTVRFGNEVMRTVRGQDRPANGKATLKVRNDKRFESQGTCSSSLGFYSSMPVSNGQSEFFTNTISATFVSSDCDVSPELHRLPRSIDAGDWEDNNITFTVFVGRLSYFSVNAKIVAVEVEAHDVATVHGTMYSDLNDNCVIEAQEATLGGRVIEFLPGPYYASTRQNGTYNVVLPLGDYTAQVIKRPLWGESCASNAANLSLQTKDEIVEHNLAMQPEVYQEVANVSIMSTFARPGLAGEYVIRVENVGTLSYNGTVRLTHDARFTDFSSEPEADFYAAPVAEWEIRDLGIGDVVIIEVLLTTPADIGLLGEILCSTVESAPNKGTDEILSETQDEICVEVRGSYDPNDIQVFTEQRNADGEILADDKVLTYLIRFQNEGNEDALTVRVVDKLSQYHNIGTLRFGATSHPAEINLNSKGEIEWVFNDINLAPKERDEAASQGFVKFEVVLQDELQPGTEIPNKADIYFDFNPPIITNRVISRIANASTDVEESAELINVEVFPNPSSEQLTVRFTEAIPAKLTLRNVLGETLQTVDVNSADVQLDVQTLAPGAYYLTVRTGDAELVKPINIVR